LSCNADGSDHGWGGHHFIAGGAVAKTGFYGVLPQMGIGHKDDLGGGRLLPSTAVAQLGAELGSWFGVNASELKLIFPQLAKFDTHPLNILPKS
jgi:uncharacterized protein (DUF1501 family)